MTKTREEVVQECIGAMIACWNHYADTPLDAYYMTMLDAAIGGTLPEHITMRDWQQDADEYDRRTAEG